MGLFDWFKKTSPKQPKKNNISEYVEEDVFRLAIEASDSGDYKACRVIINTYLEENISNESRVKALTIRGTSYYEEGKKEEALADFKEIISQDPNHKVKTIVERMENSKAESSSHQSQPPHPDILELLKKANNYLFETKDYSKAIGCLDKVIELTENDEIKSMAHAYRGLAYMQSGQEMIGMAELEHSLILDPQNELANRLLK